MYSVVIAHLQCLLGLLRKLCLLAFTSSLCGLGSGLSVHGIIPPSEAASIVTNEFLMMDVVMFRTSPEGKEMVQAPWEIITTVRVDGLEKTAYNP